MPGAMLDLIESFRSEEASISKLFGGEGQRVSHVRHDPEQLLGAMTFIEEVEKGRRPLWQLKEAMTTSDFPALFADIFDRQLLGEYQATTPTWQNYLRRGVVSDFKGAKRFAVDGAEGILPEVDEREEYPEEPLTEAFDTLTVKKHGRRIDLSWEMQVNDDLDAFRRNPARLARAAQRTETFHAVSLFTDENGPHPDLYGVGYNNVVPGNPPLSIESLQAAYSLLSQQVDEDGEPIVIEMVELVVGPALEVAAENILNATALWVGEGAPGVTAPGQTLQTGNWMKGRLRLNVEPYIPAIAKTANGASSWFMFASPGTGRNAAELAFLRGNEQPALYQRVPNAQRIGGGGGTVQESFEDDSVAWRVRHVLGGARLTETGGRKFTVASDGSGS